MSHWITKLRVDLSKKSPLYIKVKFVPHSPQTEVVEVMADGTYKIRVAAPAEKGKANAALIRFLKKSLGANEVIIMSGKTERVKLLKITLH